MCSWKGELGKTRNWNVLSWKVWIRAWSWTLSYINLTFQLLLTNQNSIVATLILSKLKQNCSSVTFKLHAELFNFNPNFSTSDRTFELLSIQFHVGLSYLKLSNFCFFFSNALSNYMYPHVNSIAMQWLVMQYLAMAA